MWKLSRTYLQDWNKTSQDRLVDIVTKLMAGMAKESDFDSVFLCAKQPGCEADHSPPSAQESKIAWTAPPLHHLTWWYGA
jgi:hypothetical protein